MILTYNDNVDDIATSDKLIGRTYIDTRPPPACSIKMVARSELGTKLVI